MGSTSSASRSFGSHPSGMNRAVIKPHAMNAPMFGMTMPLRKLPNLWTLTLRLVPVPTSPYGKDLCPQQSLGPEVPRPLPRRAAPPGRRAVRRPSQQELPVEERLLEVQEEPGAVGAVRDAVVHRQRG